MSIIDQLRTQGASIRITEEILYAEVLREMEQGIRRDGLWAQAMSRSNMRENEAQAKYITLRVQSLKDEISLLESQIRKPDKPQEEKEQIIHKKPKIQNNESEKILTFPNFGFGFIFVGFLLNILALGIFAKLNIADYIYNPWWLAYGVISAISGLVWMILKKSTRV